MQVGSGTESIRVPGRVIDLGMWLVLLGKEESPSAPSARGDEIWRARMRLALRVQGWCEDVAMTALIEATRLRLAAWAATVARVRSLAELQETTSELERGWAYIFDILGSTTPVWHKAGYRLDEVVLWNAFADVLVAILPLAIGPVGDVGQGAMLADQRAHAVGIIPFVRNHRRSGLEPLEQGCGAGDVVVVAGRDQEADRPAFAVDARVDLGREPAPAATNTTNSTLFLTPEAC